MVRRALLVVLGLALATPAPAAPRRNELSGVCWHCAPPSKARRAAAVAVAIFPGFIFRGAGTYILGKRGTAVRLAKVGAIGLAGMAAGGIPIGATGAPPQLSYPLLPVLLAGGALFVPTWFADIWTAAGLDSVSGAGRALPPYALELGTVWLHDGERDRGLGRLAGGMELGPVGVGATALLDAGGDARTFEGSASWRITGAPARGDVVDDTSRFGVRATLRHHRDVDDANALLTGDLEVYGRYDLMRLDRILHGTFIDASLGFGLERASYDATSATDLGSLVLGRFAWGAYLGDRGEAQIFYDHRRDSLAGGLAAVRAAGFLGSVGATALVPVHGPWLLRAEVEVGAAWVTTLGVRYQGGLR